jgi:hypothetical protein
VDLESTACVSKSATTTSTEVKPKVELPIVEQLQGFTTTAAMYLSDVAHTWQLIVGVGGGVAVVAGFVWLVLMKLFAGVIVWATIVSLILMVSLLISYSAARPPFSCPGIQEPIVAGADESAEAVPFAGGPRHPDMRLQVRHADDG